MNAKSKPSLWDLKICSLRDRHLEPFKYQSIVELSRDLSSSFSEESTFGRACNRDSKRLEKFGSVIIC